MIGSLMVPMIFGAQHMMNIHVNGNLKQGSSCEGKMSLHIAFALRDLLYFARGRPISIQTIATLQRRTSLLLKISTYYVRESLTLLTSISPQTYSRYFNIGPRSCFARVDRVENGLQRLFAICLALVHVKTKYELSHPPTHCIGLLLSAMNVGRRDGHGAFGSQPNAST